MVVLQCGSRQTDLLPRKYISSLHCISSQQVSNSLFPVRQSSLCSRASMQIGLLPRSKSAGVACPVWYVWYISTCQWLFSLPNATLVPRLLYKYELSRRNISHMFDEEFTHYYHSSSFQSLSNIGRSNTTSCVRTTGAIGIIIGPWQNYT